MVLLLKKNERSWSCRWWSELHHWLLVPLLFTRTLAGITCLLAQKDMKKHSQQRIGTVLRSTAKFCSFFEISSLTTNFGKGSVALSAFSIKLSHCMGWQLYNHRSFFIVYRPIISCFRSDSVKNVWLIFEIIVSMTCAVFWPQRVCRGWGRQISIFRPHFEWIMQLMSAGKTRAAIGGVGAAINFVFLQIYRLRWGCPIDFFDSSFRGRIRVYPTGMGLRVALLAAIVHFRPLPLIQRAPILRGVHISPCIVKAVCLHVVWIARKCRVWCLALVSWIYRFVHTVTRRWAQLVYCAATLGLLMQR